jgi:hypothetical protein
MALAMSAYTRKSEKFQIKNLMIYIKLLEKQKQAISQISRFKEVIKIRAEINEIETKRRIH